MYSNHEYKSPYDYDKRVEIIDPTSRKVLKVFYARELSAINESANFVGGGIATGGQAFVIGTLDDIKEFAKPYATQMVVEGIKEYKLVGVDYKEDGTTALHTYKTKYETVLYLN